jgi:putative flippase GtrA
MPGTDPLRPASRYILVGAAAWVADVALFWLVAPYTSLIGAQVAARLFGALLAFFGHKLWAFEDTGLQRGRLALQGLGYAGLWLVSSVVSTLLLLVFAEVVGLADICAKVAAEGLTVVLNFMVMRGVIFAPMTPWARWRRGGAPRLARKPPTNAGI